MKIIEKEILEQTKATLNKTDYIRSPNVTENIIQSPWTSVINSVGTYQWIIIGVGIFTITSVVLIVIFKLCKKQGQTEHAMSINIANNQNMTNTSPSAPITTLAHTGTNPIEPANPQEEPQPHLDPPSYASLDPAILNKDPALYTTEDRIAIRRSWKEKNRKQ